MTRIAGAAVRAAVLVVALAVAVPHPGCRRNSSAASDSSPAQTAPASPSGHPAPGEPGFGSWWHDGKAELDGYRLEIIRYGQPRRGQAVLVYVTEPFSESKRVKVDNPAANPGDTFDVLKLNLVRDFQTGIYDYNTMVSLFDRSATFKPVKESFSSEEWCGHVYQETIFGPEEISQKYFSYFENESSEHTLDFKREGVVEENLFILLRGLNGPYLEPGQRRVVDFLPGPFYTRLTHHPGGWTDADIERLPQAEEIDVPAGHFPTFVYIVRTGDHRVGRFNIETVYPHRIVRWSWERFEEKGPGAQKGGGAPAEGMDSGELAGSARLEYWKLHGNGDESYLKELGIEPTVK